MSAKLVLMMLRMPKSLMAHGACSRLEPQPKLSPATRIFELRYGSWFSTKSGRSAPSFSESKRSSKKAETPRPVRLMVLRNCFGMIMSVSTFWMSSLAAMPFSVVNLSIPALFPPPEAAVGAAEEGCATAAFSTSRVTSMAAWTKSRAAVTGVSSGSTLGSRLRTSVRVPVTAAAAAMAGDTRCVRPPFPCLPSKFRFDVEAHRSWGWRRSGFMARHMEQPGSRKSKPASTKILSRPSATACALTRPEPGTIMACTPSATFRPLATSAAARRSSMRALVHEPMKTLSSFTPSSFWPGSSPM
mmetsp:Transcript_1486/g.6500  ORF Transcript_1486/g.6500 Transcript_1486/m.6500 type:complete len:301 (-) Transcript_1486:1289-2191(-)